MFCNGYCQLSKPKKFGLNLEADVFLGKQSRTIMLLSNSREFFKGSYPFGIFLKAQSVSEQWCQKDLAKSSDDVKQQYAF